MNVVINRLVHLKQVVGNSLKSLEVSEDKANQRVEEFKRQLKSLTIKLKEAETRAENAEKNVKKLQKEVDRLEGTLRERGWENLLVSHRRPGWWSTWFSSDTRITLLTVVALTYPTPIHTR